MYSVRHADVFQDGADFYEETELACPKLATYPHKVKDHDEEQAEQARSWFINVWCRENKIIPRFAEC